MPKVGDVRSQNGGTTTFWTSRQLARIKPTIKAADLASTPPPLTTPPPPTPASIPQRNGQIVSNVARDVNGLITAQTEEAQRARELAQEMGALGDQGSLSDLFAQQRQDLGIDQNLRELRDIQLRLSETDTASELTKTRIEGAAGQTMGQAQREVTQEDRENAVRRSGDAARAAVLQGHIDTATQLARDTVNMAFQDRTLKAQNILQQLNYYQGVADDQTAQLLEQDKRQYEAELAQIEELKTNIASAMVSGATSSEISQLNDPALDDASKLALAQQITARGANQMRNLDIQQKQASIANSYDAIRDRKERMSLELQKFVQADAEAQQQLKTENEAKSEKALGMLASVNELLNHPGFGAAVGPNPLARMEFNPLLGGVFAGVFSGDKSDFQGEVDMLANTLTLENMSMLKGPATDKDVEIVANSVSKLKNMDVSETAYTEELNRLRAAAQRIVDKVGITPEQASFYFGADQSVMSEVNSIWGDTAQSSALMVNSSY
jgi:hypothetical protein